MKKFVFLLLVCVIFDLTTKANNINTINYNQRSTNTPAKENNIVVVNSVINFANYLYTLNVTPIGFFDKISYAIKYLYNNNKWAFLGGCFLLLSSLFKVIQFLKKNK